MTNTKALYQAIMDDMTCDEEFVKAFVSSGDAETLCGVLTAKGYDVTVDDVKAMFEQGSQIIVERLGNDGDELTAEQLEEVAGGGFLRGTLRLVVSCAVAFGYGAFCAVCPAAAGGSTYVAVGLGAWTTAGYLKKGW